MWSHLLMVALGGAIGASGRFLAGRAALWLLGPGFPWGTLFVNVAGSLVMGVLVAVMALKGGTKFAPFLTVGMLGGFTTFSSFSLDAVTLWERGQAGLAATYVLTSVIVSLGALFAGLTLTRMVLQ
ncbi:fluoride efflux transporter CrcB [Mangrovicoccus algicola]|uniref:Fluoride-specific ion channel FluC n=1 Tax=Mangrovicoccus algicola TaxID=2771008 RepID=A0A8J6YWN1_9RHOB|nr:fluoride efflux transporter CrcB [Mangrovicoccus algicola]MBE3637403.1 fluoride efflux transporter CrcB [Mangrovicoccus algicola]